VKIAHEQHDHICLIRLEGEMTVDDIDPLKELVVEQLAGSMHDFVLDLSAVDFVDSKGLETLLWVQDEANERLGQVRLVAPSETVSTILHITRLDAALDQHRSADAALSSLR